MSERSTTNLSQTNKIVLNGDGSIGTLKSQIYVTGSIAQTLRTTFLPVGYPHSVKKEYLTYQIWDSVQGMSSYLRGVLTTNSILTGAGVGSAEASVVSASLAWVFKDGVGMIGSLIFAYYCADLFEVHCKEWRLLADILNNIALTLDLCISIFPHQFLLITSMSTLCRACCGLVAGATKARISAHFAEHGHLADVTAKESTQETAVSLLGLVFGMICSRLIGSDERSVWVVFFVLMIIHQWSNYNLVRVLVFDCLNPQRCYLIARVLDLDSSSVSENTASKVKPESIATLETLARPIWLRTAGPRMSESLEVILTAMRIACPATDGSVTVEQMWRQLVAVWSDQASVSPSSNVSDMHSQSQSQPLSLPPFIIGIDSACRPVVCLSQHCSESQQIQAYIIAATLQIRWTRLHDLPTAAPSRLSALYLKLLAAPKASDTCHTTMTSQCSAVALQQWFTDYCRPIVMAPVTAGLAEGGVEGGAGAGCWDTGHDKTRLGGQHWCYDSLDISLALPSDGKTKLS